MPAVISGGQVDQKPPQSNKNRKANFYGADILQIALQLNERGYTVFPCARHSKATPPTRDELKHLKAPQKSLDLKTIYKADQSQADVEELDWSRAWLIGVQMRGLLAVDLDTKHSCFVLAEEAALYDWPHYATQSSSGGGRHFISRVPEGVIATNGTVYWNGQHVGETRSGNAYICVYQPQQLRSVLELPEFDPDELSEGLTLTNTGFDVAAKPKSLTIKLASPTAFEVIKAMVYAQPPAARHDALVAVLNIGYRLGILEPTEQLLASDEVWQFWANDGSRSVSEWRREITRWVQTVRTRNGRGFGIPFLKQAGFDVAQLSSLLHTVAAQTEVELPKILVKSRHVRDISAESLNAISASNSPPTIFLMGQVLVRLLKHNGLVMVEPLSQAALRGVLERVADYVVPSKSLEVSETQLFTPSRCPNDVPNDLLSLPAEQISLPKLRSLVQIPIFTKSGKLVIDPGFDEETGVYLDLTNLSGMNQDMPLSAAKALLFDELLVDFQFANLPASRAHVIALLLQPFVRQMIEGLTPLYLIEASSPGAGKGLLADVFALICTGHHIPVTVFSLEQGELEKRITATLSSGKQIVAFDNVTRLGGSVIDAALTAHQWEGRILGRSQMRQFPNQATWIATANNVTLMGDTPRRVIPIRLEPDVERPEHRHDFKHPMLKNWVRQHRNELVSALLSIVKHWQNAGSPYGNDHLGSFEEWSRVMGGILQAAEIPGFLEGREYLYNQSQQQPLEWKQLIVEIYKRHGSDALSARDILTIAREMRVLPEIYANRSDLSTTQRMGRELIAIRERVFSGLQIKTNYNAHLKVNEYRINQLPLTTPQTPQQAN